MRRLILFLSIFALPLLSEAQNPPYSASFKPIADSITSYLGDRAQFRSGIAFDTLLFVTSPNNHKTRNIAIYFSPRLSEYPIRDIDVRAINAIVSGMLPEYLSKYPFTIFSSNTSLEDLSSQYYSIRKPSRKTKSVKTPTPAPWVRNISLPYTVSKGLQQRHIALWQSHGLYYEQSLYRWEWQRPRLFETVEDLYTQSFVIPFLVPMLENAGACVMLPRERDMQEKEVIVDNNGPYYREDVEWTTAPLAGFANPKESYLFGENPFLMGDARMMEMPKKSKTKAHAMWMPSFPATGSYAVYVSYNTLPQSTADARYTVRHLGGETSFSVNQTIGGGTWVYLGTFDFSEGWNSQGVILESKSGAVVVADAVKFGGGMGNMARRPGNPLHLTGDSLSYFSSALFSLSEDSLKVYGETSRYPRWTEGARYWLQWAGFDTTVYSPHNGLDDYKDDYKSRGLWVNALKHSYNVPVDLSLAFHTDAGISLTDSIIGTLTIYTRYSEGKDMFQDGRPRLLSRELSDIVQSQIVSDIRSTYEPDWNRRGLADRAYFECRLPDVPSMLLELLAHQNFADMRYGLDPKFRFTVSRAIYKGILRFLASTGKYEYVVQPLPVSSFAAILSSSDSTVTLSWTPVKDSLESTATPKSYVVYHRVIDPSDTIGGFDNGTPVADTLIRFRIEPGMLHSFKVVAVNEGGASFPSEILSVGMAPRHSLSSTEHKEALIVNCFDRISAPASFATNDSTRAGFIDFVDGGVPYISDYSYVGRQYAFERKLSWSDDDAPGFGGSYGNMETTRMAGNTFDFPLKHGMAMMNAGYDFSSCSRDAVTLSQTVKMTSYSVVDLIMGKQVTTQTGRCGASQPSFEVFPLPLQRAISEYCSSGRNLLISGAYIATDVWDGIYEKDSSQVHSCTDSLTRDFVSSVLKYKYLNGFSSTDGSVRGAGATYSFYTSPNPFSYCVESPDGLLPVGKGAQTIFRYSESNISAGVAYRGDSYKTVALGFPLETLTSQRQLNEIVRDIIRFFER